MKQLTKKEIIEFVEEQRNLYKRLQKCYENDTVENDRYFSIYIELDYILNVISGEIERV